MIKGAGMFHCPACAAGFAWKPKYAGHKVRCKCGEVFAAADPQRAAAEPQRHTSPQPHTGPQNHAPRQSQAGSPGPDPYGIGDEPPVAAVKRTIIPAARPAPSAVARPAAVVAPPDADLPSDPHAIPASAVAFYARKSRYAAEAENAEPEEGSNLKNVYVLLALGLGLRVSQLVYANANGANKWAATGDAVAQPGRAVLLALCELVISTTIMVCGATAAAMLLDINFGPIAKAGLKLAATAVFATGVAGWVAVFDRDRHSITGMVVALHIVVIIYWIALAFFFSLELQETMLTVAIISLIQAAGMCVLWKA